MQQGKEAAGHRGADINVRVDSSFGEVAGWQRVSYYQTWIGDSRRVIPDEAGLDDWCDVMAAGHSWAEVLIGFALSDENRANMPLWQRCPFSAGSARIRFLSA